MAGVDLEVLVKTISYLQTLRKTEELTQLVAKQTVLLAAKDTQVSQALEQAKQFKTLYEELAEQHAGVLEVTSSTEL